MAQNGSLSFSALTTHTLGDRLTLGTKSRVQLGPGINMLHTVILKVCSLTETYIRSPRSPFECLGRAGRELSFFVSHYFEFPRCCPLSSPASLSPLLLLHPLHHPLPFMSADMRFLKDGSRQKRCQLGQSYQCVLGSSSQTSKRDMIY